jgi:hypothetical protein
MLIAWSTVIFGMALVLICVAGILVFQSEAPEQSFFEQMTLRVLSQQWVRHKPSIKIEGVKHISELAHLWRDELLIAQKIEQDEWTNPRSSSFSGQLRTWPFFRKARKQQAVCIELLRRLDREGQCPSVVNVQGDVEAVWEQNTYRILAKTSLLDHSLNVAEQVVKLLSDNQAWHVIPDTMVAALGHDLGKLKSAQGSLYSLGEHPLAAGAIISGIPGFKELSRKDDILRAIKLHHKMPEGLLGKTLKKADQQARQQELECWTGAETPEEIKASQERTALQNPPQMPTRTTVQRVQADIYGETIDPAPNREEIAPPQRMDISGWFDAAGYLKMLRPYINRVEGRRFMAFSMADGLVYFQVKALEEVARKQAQQAGCMEIATMAQDDPTMRQVLFTTVQHLRQDHEVIAGDLIKDTYFGGYFMVTRKHGKAMRGYYTPFHAEAFGSIAEMERDKPDLLRDILSVSPYTGSDQVS